MLGIYSSYALLNEFDQLRARARSGGIEASDLVEGGVFGDTYTQAIFLDPEFDIESRVFDDEFDTYGITADVEWSNDDWTAKGALHYSGAGYDRFAIQSRRNIDFLEKYLTNLQVWVLPARPFRSRVHFRVR